MTDSVIDAMCARGEVISREAATAARTEAAATAKAEARTRYGQFLWAAFNWGKSLPTHGAPHFYEFRQSVSKTRKPLDMRNPGFKLSLVHLASRAATS